MKKNLLTTVLLSLALTGLFAQKKVAPLPVDSTFSYGQNYFFYALPKTVFKVDMFAGTVIELGKELGILVPVNEYIYKQVKQIEAGY